MSIDYEKASGNLTGPNIPEVATNTFPSQYAHFNELGSYARGLGVVRDLTHFPQAYRAAWIGLCMQVDRNAQGKLPNVKLNSPSSQDQRLEAIKEYWEKLADTSIYPVFTHQKAELVKRKYSEGALTNWREPGPEFSERQRPYRNIELVAGIFSSVWNRPLVLRAWNYTPHARDSAGGIDQNVVNLHNQIEQNAGGELLQYVIALQFLVAARGLSVGRVSNVARLLEKAHQGQIVYEIPNPQATIDKLLKRTEPYYLFATRINPVLKKTEKRLFGDNADLARTLWTAASHLRLGRIVRPSNGFTSLREPLVKMLVDEKFDDARFYVEELMAQHPQILPDFVAEKLRIEPDVLRGLYADE